MGTQLSSLAPIKERPPFAEHEREKSALGTYRVIRGSRLCDKLYLLPTARYFNQILKTIFDHLEHARIITFLFGTEKNVEQRETQYFGADQFSFNFIKIIEISRSNGSNFA